MYSKLDNKGNIITGTTAILIVSLLLIFIFVINAINNVENDNIESIENDNFKYIINDYNKNLEEIGRNSIAEETEKLYHGHIIHDSRKDIKKILNNKLKDVNKEYKEKYGVEIRSEVVSVESTDSPWKVLFKVHIRADKDNNQYDGILQRNSSIEGLKDPLPFAMLSAYSNIDYDDTTIHYFQSLSQYLLVNNVNSYESYILATAPMIIKKCPYDPYIHHGDGDTMKDCLKNGYFHESADGSCYLCRLDGDAVCPHYGMEVFIQPHTPLTNGSVSCSDHVVFHDHYEGEKLNKLDINSLILDSSHAKKYGLDYDDGQ